MQRIIVSDIFGKTNALEAIAASLSGEVSIFQPYTDKSKSFDTEQHAYEFFVTEVGLQTYTEELEKYLSEFEKPVSLLGFSVGASAIWNLSNKLSTKTNNNIAGALCFYGSQIRHAKKVVPSFPIQLVFPRSEKHFSVTDLADTLMHIKHVNIHQSHYLHGFMNQLSDNFNQQGYEHYLQILKSVPRNQSFHGSSF